MKEYFSICPRCEGNACFTQELSEGVSTYLDFGCGFTSSTLMVSGSALVAESLNNSPELYKDLMFVDKDNLVWFPSTINLAEKGMVFLDGTSKENWVWTAIKAVRIKEEDKNQFPEGQEYKMDMTSAQRFGQKGFMDALEVIGFFNTFVAEEAQKTSDL